MIIVDLESWTVFFRCEEFVVDVFGFKVKPVQWSHFVPTGQDFDFVMMSRIDYDIQHLKMEVWYVNSIYPLTCS